MMGPNSVVIGGRVSAVRVADLGGAVFLLEHSDNLTVDVLIRTGVTSGAATTIKKVLEKKGYFIVEGKLTPSDGTIMVTANRVAWLETKNG